MPGNSRESQTGYSLFICRLDTGSASQFPRDMSSMSYGYSMSQHRWTKLEVKNSEFMRSCPVAALSLGPQQMLIFGGASTKCFLMDTRSVYDNRRVTVETATTQLTTEAHFGVISVQHTSHQGTNYYAIDANRKFFYNLDINNLGWKCKSLRELGIDST